MSNSSMCRSAVLGLRHLGAEQLDKSCFHKQFFTAVVVPLKNRAIQTYWLPETQFKIHSATVYWYVHTVKCNATYWCTFPLLAFYLSIMHGDLIAHVCHWDIFLTSSRRAVRLGVFAMLGDILADIIMTFLYIRTGPFYDIYHMFVHETRILSHS